MSARILTVCSGNICRSPLAEALLRRELSGLDVVVESAGTIAADGAQMPDEAQRLAENLRVSPAEAAAHRSRYLDTSTLDGASLVLAMSREHRRRVVELDPRRLRSTFTAREFARLATNADDALVRDAARAAGPAPERRVTAVIETVVAQRGIAPLPLAPDDDVGTDAAGRAPPAAARCQRSTRPDPTTQE